MGIAPPAGVLASSPPKSPRETQPSTSAGDESTASTSATTPSGAGGDAMLRGGPELGAASAATKSAATLSVPERTDERRNTHRVDDVPPLLDESVFVSESGDPDLVSPQQIPSPCASLRTADGGLAELPPGSPASIDNLRNRAFDALTGALDTGHLDKVLNGAMRAPGTPQASTKRLETKLAEVQKELDELRKENEALRKENQVLRAGAAPSNGSDAADTAGQKFAAGNAIHAVRAAANAAS